MSLSKDIQIAVKGLREDAERFVRATNLELFSSIIRDTPVDTGRLRGNWQTTVDVPASGILERLGEAEAIADAQSTLKGFGLYWLTNNLPYAAIAEFGGWPHATEKTTPAGYSVQAPAGMVRKNATRIRAIMRNHR